MYNAKLGQVNTSVHPSNCVSSGCVGVTRNVFLCMRVAAPGTCPVAKRGGWRYISGATKIIPLSSAPRTPEHSICRICAMATQNASTPTSSSGTTTLSVTPSSMLGLTSVLASPPPAPMVASNPRVLESLLQSACALLLPNPSSNSALVVGGSEVSAAVRGPSGLVQCKSYLLLCHLVPYLCLSFFLGSYLGRVLGGVPSSLTCSRLL